MRMFLLFILLFIPITSSANTTLETCQEHGGTQTDCNQTAGCFYDNESSETNKCLRCQEDRYCPADKTSPQDCPQAFSESEPGATSENECYRNISETSQNNYCTATDGTQNTQCGLFYPNDTPKCWDNAGNYDTNYHTENPDGTQLYCYANTLQCASFTNNNCTGNISNNAQWESSEWDIRNCKCSKASFENDTTKLCSGVNINASPKHIWIDYATEFIDYSKTPEVYYCTRCIQDDDNSKYYASTENGDGCTANLNTGTVCKCETSTYRGHYRTGKCCTDISCQEWDNPSDICRRVACDVPGTTTAELLPTSNDNSVCIYTAQTELRDTKSDFTLGDLNQPDYGNLDPTGWKLVP